MYSSNEKNLKLTCEPSRCKPAPTRLNSSGGDGLMEATSNSGRAGVACPSSAGAWLKNATAASVPRIFCRIEILPLQPIFSNRHAAVSSVQALELALAQ